MGVYGYTVTGVGVFVVFRAPLHLKKAHRNDVNKQHVF
jgi:hypothetical protein